MGKDILALWVLLLGAGLILLNQGIRSLNKRSHNSTKKRATSIVSSQTSMPELQDAQTDSLSNNHKNDKFYGYLLRFIPIALACLSLGSCTTGLILFNRAIGMIGIISGLVLFIYLPAARIAFGDVSLTKSIKDQKDQFDKLND